MSSFPQPAMTLNRESPLSLISCVIYTSWDRSQTTRRLLRHVSQCFSLLLPWRHFLCRDKVWPHSALCRQGPCAYSLMPRLGFQVCSVHQHHLHKESATQHFTLHPTLEVTVQSFLQCFPSHSSFNDSCDVGSLLFLLVFLSCLSLLTCALHWLRTLTCVGFGNDVPASSRLPYLTYLNANFVCPR